VGTKVSGRGIGRGTPIFCLLSVGKSVASASVYPEGGSIMCKIRFIYSLIFTFFIFIPIWGKGGQVEQDLGRCCKYLDNLTGLEKGFSDYKTRLSNFIIPLFGQLSDLDSKVKKMKDENKEDSGRFNISCVGNIVVGLKEVSSRGKELRSSIGSSEEKIAKIKKMSGRIKDLRWYLEGQKITQNNCPNEGLISRFWDSNGNELNQGINREYCSGENKKIEWIDGNLKNFEKEIFSEENEKRKKMEQIQRWVDERGDNLLIQLNGNLLTLKSEANGRVGEINRLLSGIVTGKPEKKGVSCIVCGNREKSPETKFCRICGMVVRKNETRKSTENKKSKADYFDTIWKKAVVAKNKVFVWFGFGGYCVRCKNSTSDSHASYCDKCGSTLACNGKFKITRDSANKKKI
jgi:hypothetical protein